MMSRAYKDLQLKYEHALDSLWSLFKFGLEREKAMEEKLNNIRLICERSSSDADKRVEEVIQVLNDHRNGE